MTKRSSGWRQAAKNAARDYPQLKRQLNDLRSQGGQSLNGMPAGSEAHRTTEDLALRELPYTQQRRLDAVEQAIAMTAQLSSGPSRVRLVELVYFQPQNRRFLLEGAAMQIPCSVQTAKIWNNDFLLLVWSKLRGQ